MRRSATCRLGAFATCWLVILLLALLNTHALGQQVSVQTQTEYRVVEAELADGSTESFGRFSPLLVLTLRGPLLGGSNTYFDVGFSGYQSGDPSVSVDQRSLRLNLLAQGTRLNLLASLNRDASRVSSVRTGGGRETSLVSSDSYALSGLLSYPGYPTVSLQSQKSVARGDDGGEVEVTNRSIGANYQWGPLRITADDVTQTVALQSLSSRSRTYGVSFNQSALSTVRMSLDHYSISGRLTSVRSASGASTHITRARVSALPTPYLAVDAELTRLGSKQEVASGTQADSTGWERALYLRSEVVPGWRFDFSRRLQVTGGELARASADQLSGSMVGQIHPTTALLAQWDHGTAQDQTGRGISGRRGRQVSLITALSPGTDLRARYGRSSQVLLSSEYDAVSADIGLHHRLDLTLSLDIAYRYYRLESRVREKAEKDTTHGLQLDATWLPDPRWGLRAGLGLARHDDSRRGVSLAPSLDARWEMDAATTVTVRYYLSRTREELRAGEVSPTASTASADLTGRLVHRLANGGTVEIEYDYVTGREGPFAWQKVLQIRHVRSF